MPPFFFEEAAAGAGTGSSSFFAFFFFFFFESGLPGPASSSSSSAFPVCSDREEGSGAADGGTSSSPSVAFLAAAWAFFLAYEEQINEFRSLADKTSYKSNLFSFFLELLFLFFGKYFGPRFFWLLIVSGLDLVA